ncbi:methylated-DNA--[protein]-cysteine S-methyltransferase [Enterococcus saccharolyticus]|uniref:Methylated-DNA--protein-cysteine methyltransferase n=1 Tax=Candidatus Enterococcus willemsii TaxID=1857215 RepID=A0ABQ6YZD0_9ENTE|nr:MULTISPECIES: methylated-DNA--[protein]-cysteine S-methyltransferase [Enterococcus]KAF1303096.1 cysteine methyltransferase [Enterococcus sp. CU12B]MCD5001554.1 methylated-DNA--[protein]-cysteine S-methyltransferase [Enterococcus saccharolyticus]
MNTLYTDIVERNGETYRFVATDKGLAYFDLYSKEDELVFYFKDAAFIQDKQRIAPYVDSVVEYFTGETTTFDFPLDLIGTDFQKQVWTELRKVPYGTTTTYSSLAEKIGRPTAVRAVANAVGRNPLLVIVPCHRVLGKDGSLTGFRGGLPLKRRLLAIEGHAY